jgi:O-antigen ligase
LDWSLPQLFDIACVVMLILGGVIPILFPATGTVGSTATPEQQSGMFRLLYNGISASFLGYFAVTSYRNRFQIPLRLISVRLACLFVVYALGSLFWGVSPLKVTFLGSTLLVGMFAYAFYLFQHYSPRQLHVLITVSFAFLAALSIFMAVVLPHYGVDSTGNNGAWQGAFGQKNQLGTAMVMSLAAAVTFPSHRRSSKAALVLLSLIPLAFSRSRESWAAAATCLMALALIRGISRFNKRDRLFIVVSAAVFLTALGIFVAVYEKEILALMGRDTTFSGRTKIWAAVFQLILRRPLLGYGLASATGTSIWTSVETAAGWEFGAGSTHSIYLDALFRFGVVGTTILVSSLLLGAKNFFKTLASGSVAQLEFPVLAALGILVCGVGGHGLFEIPGIQLMLLFLALFELDRYAHPRI